MQTLAHWILVVDAIKGALEHCLGESSHMHAHSTRSVSTTLALLRGVGWPTFFEQLIGRRIVLLPTISSEITARGTPSLAWQS